MILSGVLFFLVYVFSTDVPTVLPPVDCTETSVFDVSSLSCFECTEGMEPDVLKRKCVCALGTSKTYATDGTVSCTSCPESSSQDRDRCMTCNPASTTFDPASKECVCTDSSYRLVEVDIGSTLNPLGEKSCVPCPFHSKVSETNPNECLQKCPDNMSYNSAGETCSCLNSVDYIGEDDFCYLSNSESSTGYSGDITVTGLKISDGARANELSRHYTSPVIKRIFLENVALCQGQKDPKACNAVANLCVLSLYDTNSRACSVYTNGLGDYSDVSYTGTLYNGWKEGYPWLAYPDGNREQVYSKMLPVDFSKDLQFYVSEYTVDGEWLGLRRFEGNELFLCSKGSSFVENLFSRLGTNLEMECFLNLRYLYLREKPTIMEFFLKMKSGDYMRPIPVQIKRTTGTTFNYYDVKHDDLLLYRRFFLYDNYLLPDQVIRYLEEVSVNFFIMKGELRVPVITLKYGAREVSALNLESTTAFNTTSLGSESLSSPLVSFICEYESTQNTFFIIMLVFVIFVLVCGVGITFVRCYLYMMRRKEQVLDFSLGFFSFFDLANNAGNLYFILLCVYSLFYLSFYKLQDEVLVVVPTRYQNIGYFISLPVCLFLKCCDMAWCIYKQTSYDIFFIDWERSKGKLEGEKENKILQVSCWRSYFVANQWLRVYNSEKFVHFEALYIIAGFFLIGLKIIYGANESIKWLPDDQIPTNVVIRFSLITIFLFGFGFLEYLYRRIIHFRFIKDPLKNLIDLCSVSNISILILAEKYFGHYIHGQSLYTYADINVKQFAHQLQQEVKDTVPSRGLDPQGDNKKDETSCFLVYFSPEVRTEYDNLVNIPRDAEEKKSRNINIDLEFTKVKLHQLFYPEFKVGNVDSLYDKHEQMNDYLKKFIDKIKEDKTQVIRKEFQHRLGFPPIATGEHSKLKSLFMMDDSYSFSSLFLRGQAIRWLIFNVLLFNTLDLLIKNVMIVSFICLFLNKAIEVLRQWRNFKNMHKKTLLDSRFFL